MLMVLCAIRYSCFSSFVPTFFSFTWFFFKSSKQKKNFFLFKVHCFLCLISQKKQRLFSLFSLKLSIQNLSNGYQAKEQKKGNKKNIWIPCNALQNYIRRPHQKQRTKQLSHRPNGPNKKPRKMEKKWRIWKRTKNFFPALYITWWQKEERNIEEK